MRQHHNLPKRAGEIPGPTPPLRVVDDSLVTSEARLPKGFHASRIRDRSSNDYCRVLGIDLVDKVRLLISTFPDRPVRVLDIGSGRGRALLELKQLFGDAVDAVGLDQFKYSDGLYPSTIVSGLENFSPNKAFDLVISVKAFHYMIDPIKELQKAFDITSLRGEMHINMPSDALRFNESRFPESKKYPSEDVRTAELREYLSLMLPGFNYDFAGFTGFKGSDPAGRMECGRVKITKLIERPLSIRPLEFRGFRRLKELKYTVNFYSSC